MQSGKFVSNYKFWYYFIMLFFGVLYYTTGIANHYYFRTVTFDYGTYNFAFWQYSHFYIGACPLYGLKGMTFFQDHFSLTLFYFIPVYWLLNWLTGTYTLTIIQITAVLIGGWSTYKLVALKTNDKWLGVISLLYYFVIQGHYSMFTGDCNIMVIVASFVPLFLYYFETERILAASVILALSLFSREDFPLWYIFIGIVLIIWHRKDPKKIRICIYYIAASVVYFILLFAVFIPYTHNANVHYSLFAYSALGATPMSALIHIIKHPVDTFMLLFKNQGGQAVYNHVKAEFYMVYLVSGAFILLYRPYYIIWFIPLLAQKMFNDDAIRWSIEWHYPIAVATILPLTVFLIIHKIPFNTLLKRGSGLFLCVLAAGVTIYLENSQHAIPWMQTDKEYVFHKNFFSPEYNSKAIHNLLKNIPPDAKVSASEHIVPQLAQRNYIYEFPDVGDAEYIAVFTFYDYYAVSEKDYASDIDNYETDPQWQIIGQTKNFILLKKQSAR